jgi:hypothetical protein
LLVLFLLSSEAFSEEVLARTARDTKLYHDYRQEQPIGTIPPNELVRIEGQNEAHGKDKDYWGFDLQVFNGSFRVEYKGKEGYVSFGDLESADEKTVAILRKFAAKLIVPKAYCDSLYRLNPQLIEDRDPFVSNYEKYIKYLFITDIHTEWYYNYPINRSYVNDLYFQITSKPYRYNFCGFITKCTKSTITFVMDCNYDQFILYGSTAKFREGKQYSVNYQIDGDYITIFSANERLFEGVFVESKTWDFIQYFFKTWPMKSNGGQASDSSLITIDSLNNLLWPVHGNKVCDYLPRDR